VGLPKAQMSIFSRYVFRQAGGALLLILLSLSGIVWISLALRELNVVTSMGQSAFTLLKMTTLGLPNFMAIIAPFALLIAVMHTLNRLNTDSEIIVLTASGATNWTVARPVMILALLVGAFVAYVNHIGMPWSLRNLRTIVLDVRTDLLTQVIQPGRFTSPEAGLTFHIRERSLNGILEGLIMNDARDPKLVQSYLAERGIIVEQNGTAYLVMSAGHIIRRADPTDPAQIIAFDKYAVDLDRFEAKATTEIPDLKPRERYFSELVNPEETSKSYRAQPNRFTAELHERFASPLYPVAFALMALAVVGQAQSTRQGRGERMAVGFAAAVGTRLAGLAVNNLVVINPAAAPLLYLIPLGAMSLSMVVFVRAARPRAGTHWIERLHDAIASLFALVWHVLPSARSRPA
jgi:lipopolysaccharide export system permease protein